MPLVQKTGAGFLSEPQNDRLDVARTRGYLRGTLDQALGSAPQVVRTVQTSHAYWLLAALHLVRGHACVRPELVLPLVHARRCADGGFGGTPSCEESSALHTLAAVQIGALTGTLDALRADTRLSAYARLQLRAATVDGCDARGACCALLTLALFGAAPARDSAEARSARDAILRCRNWDGAFGGAPAAESHAGTTFCAVASLAVLGELESLEGAETTARWLAERQQRRGGFNGRADKDADLCYSWWCVASLAMLGRAHWIDTGAALDFVDRCATAQGGLAFAPEQLCDPYHTFFGLAARTLLKEVVATSSTGESARRELQPAEMAAPIRLECAFALPAAVVPVASRIRRCHEDCGLR
jgi:geranylgeranyl transferase type-2 subunit beta